MQITDRQIVELRWAGYRLIVRRENGWYEPTLDGSSLRDCGHDAAEAWAFCWHHYTAE